MIEYKFSNDGKVLTIYNGYQYSKRVFRTELNKLKVEYTDKPIFGRSINSLAKEWATHNALYCLGYQRERTKDVDLDIPSDHPEWMYKIIGTLVWLFIK